jgi:hypothetical protein
MRVLVEQLVPVALVEQLHWRVRLVWQQLAQLFMQVVWLASTQVQQFLIVAQQVLFQVLQVQVAQEQ